MNTWIVPTAEDDPDDAGTMVKLASANPLFVFDFGNFEELDADDSKLTGTPTVTAEPDGLTLGTPTLLGDYRVRVQVSGGDPEAEYTLTCTASESLSGVTLAGRCKLLVK